MGGRASNSNSRMCVCDGTHKGVISDGNTSPVKPACITGRTRPTPPAHKRHIIKLGLNSGLVICQPPPKKIKILLILRIDRAIIRGSTASQGALLGWAGGKPWKHFWLSNALAYKIFMAIRCHAWQITQLNIGVKYIWPMCTVEILYCSILVNSIVALSLQQRKTYPRLNNELVTAVYGLLDRASDAISTSRRT